MKTLIFFYLLILITVCVSAQNRPGVQVGPVLQPHGYYSPGLFDDASNIANVNPASLLNFKNPSAAISYQFDTGIKNMFFLPDLKGYRKRNYIPFSAGIVYPYKDLFLGISFNKRYDVTYDINVEVTNIENPNGTGEIFNYKTGTEVYDYSALASYPVYIFGENNPLSLGAKLILSNLKYHTKLHLIEGSADVYTFGYAAGAEYEFKFLHGTLFKLGVFYENYADYDGPVTMNSPDDLIQIDTNLNRPPQYVRIEPNFTLMDKTPAKLNFKLACTLNPQFILAQSFSTVFWNNVSPNYKNQVESFSQILYSPSGQSITYSVGVFISDRNQENSAFENTDYSMVFLSAGAQMNCGNFIYGLEIGDSHLASAKSRRMTSLKVTAGYRL